LSLPSKLQFESSELFRMAAEQLNAVYEDLGSRLGSRKELREITDAFAAGAAGLLVLGAALSAFLLRRVP